jgi:hypothetical protein
MACPIAYIIVILLFIYKLFQIVDQLIFHYIKVLEIQNQHAHFDLFLHQTI